MYEPLAWEKGPDEFVEDAFIGRRENSGSGSALIPRQRRTRAATSESTPGVQRKSRTDSGVGSDGAPATEVPIAGTNARGIQEDLETLAVIHGVVSCLNSVGVGPHIRVASASCTARAIPELQAPSETRCERFVDFLRLLSCELGALRREN